MFPGKCNRKQLEPIDENGLVKPGSVVQYGEPLILAANVKEPAANRVHKRGARTFADAAVTWTHHSPGQVTDAVKTENGMTVLVKSIIPAQLADKLAGRYGNKGVIGKIVADEQMPHDKDGQPMEVLFNALGIISRGNPAAVLETALGKIAAKTGKPYRVPDFDKIDDLTEYVQQELKKHNLSATEDLVDPETGRKIPNVLTGSHYVMRLHHLAEDKGQGRGTGDSYSADDTPSKGSGNSSKRLALMEVNALLSHGTTSVLRDAKMARGQRNEDYWLSFVQGHTPAPPKIPMVYKKFVSSLQASGINVVSNGTGSQLMAMTDKDVDELAGDREISNAGTVDIAKNMKPEAGGLFDPKIFGDGRRWGAIKLKEPVLNPVMEEPVRRLLGLTQKQLEGVISGQEELPGLGRGPGVLQKALASINLPREIGLTRQMIAKRRGAGRDAAVKRLGYLQAAQKLGVHPGRWLLQRVPVLPPAFRPISTLGDKKIPIVADANYLYGELFDANDNLSSLSGQIDDVGQERLTVYNALKGVVGLGDPLGKKLQEKQIRGILKNVLGSSPKFGMVQRKLLSSSVDLVGRGVIAPNPDLDMDSIAIPEDKAWDVYKNFVARRLVRRGMPLSESLRNAEERTPIARDELIAEMSHRPIIASRAPTLHKFGVLAFWPRLTKSNAVEVSPQVVGGFGADFDGDQMNWHVPIEDSARKEAIEMLLPSANLFSAADFKTPMHQPTKEYVGGLYAATQPADSSKRPHRFRSKKDVIQAVARGDISMDDAVEIVS